MSKENDLLIEQARQIVSDIETAEILREGIKNDAESTLTAQAAKLLRLRRAKFKREGELKAINEELAQTTETINAILQPLERTKFDYNGKLLYQVVSSHPKIIPDKKDQFLNYLDDINEGGIAPRTIHHETLGKWYSLHPELAEELTRFLEVFEKININIKGDDRKEQEIQAYRDFKTSLGFE